MKDLTHRRHDISDRAWETLEPLLPGGKAKDNRLFLNAVQVDFENGCSMARPATQLRGLEKHSPQVLPVDGQKGIWKQLFEILTDEPDMEWLMVDATYVKVHLQAAGAVGGNQGHGSDKRRLNTKVHLAVDAHGLPFGVTVTSGTVADCKECEKTVGRG